MVYPYIDLRTAGLVVGMLLMVAHLIGLLHADLVKKWLAAFPRSRAMAILVLGIAAVWAFGLVSTMDLGEFTPYRRMLVVVVPASYFLSLKFADEFLSVRALGMVLLLAAEVPLEAAFLHPETSRLFLVALAYAWVILGLFWVGMPYLMRDQIQWVLRRKNRYVALCAAGLLYGLLLVSVSLTQHR